jgi:hypothetical protein
VQEMEIGSIALTPIAQDQPVGFVPEFTH